MTSDPPTGKGWRNVPAKYIVGALVAFATMCTSVAAYVRPETGARNSYDLLSRKLEEQGTALRQTHDDVVALRGYLDGYVRSKESAHPLTVESSSPPPGASRAAVPAPQTVVTVKPAGTVAPPPPEVGANNPPPFHAPSFDAVQGSKNVSAL